MITASKLVCVALVAAVTALSGCSENGTDEPDTSATDTASTADTGSGADSAAVNTNKGDTNKDGPVFILGTNKTGKSTPEFFKPVPENSELNVEFGPQGLWMVVLAFKTKGLLKPPMLLGGRVEMDGALLGELKLAKQKLLPGGDDHHYYYNFFLVVAPEGVAGKKAIITFTASDKDGEKVNIKHPVILTGGK